MLKIHFCRTLSIVVCQELWATWCLKLTELLEFFACSCLHKVWKQSKPGREGKKRTDFCEMTYYTRDNLRKCFPNLLHCDRIDLLVSRSRLNWTKNSKCKAMESWFYRLLSLLIGAKAILLVKFPIKIDCFEQVSEKRVLRNVAACLFRSVYYKEKQEASQNQSSASQAIETVQFSQVLQLWPMQTARALEKAPRHGWCFNFNSNEKQKQSWAAQFAVALAATLELAKLVS